MFKGALKGEMQRGYAGPLFSSLTPAGTVESHEESVHSLLRTSKKKECSQEFSDGLYETRVMKSFV